MAGWRFIERATHTWQPQEATAAATTTTAQLTLMIYEV